MIRAEQAERIMQRYEDDYDNFLDKLRAKRNAKQKQAAKAKADADQAKKTVAEAQAHKPVHLKEKAQGLLDKVGGIQGAASTAQNVVKYFKTDTPSDYQMSFGKGDDTTTAQKPAPVDGIDMTMVAMIGGGTILALVIIYGLSRLAKGTSTKIVTPAATIPAQPVLQTT